MAAKSLAEGDRRLFTEWSSCCIYVRSPISSSATIQKLEKVLVSVTQEQELWVYGDGQIPRPYLPTNIALTVNSGFIKSPIIKKIRHRSNQGKTWWGQVWVLYRWPKGQVLSPPSQRGTDIHTNSDISLSHHLWHLKKCIDEWWVLFHFISSSSLPLYC